MIGKEWPIPASPNLKSTSAGCAADSANVVFTGHAEKQMRKRHVNRSMAFDVLLRGKIVIQPEPDIKHAGLNCRMVRYVAGMNVAVVVNVEYPAPDLVIVTVIDITKE